MYKIKLHIIQIGQNMMGTETPSAEDYK